MTGATLAPPIVVFFSLKQEALLISKMLHHVLKSSQSLPEGSQPNLNEQQKVQDTLMTIIPKTRPQPCARVKNPLATCTKY